METEKQKADASCSRDSWTKAAEQLRGRIKEQGEWKDQLWDCVRLCQGMVFHTSGRGKNNTGSVAFTYQLKVSSRTGGHTDELVISRKEKSKTITRSSVELALENGLAVQAEAGCVKGPKKLGVFGASYLYSMFLTWGVIRDCPME